MNELSASDKILQLIGANQIAELKLELDEAHPADAAEALEQLDSPQVVAVLKELPFKLQASIFSYFEIELQTELAEALPRKDLVRLITHMSPDERADIFAELSEEQQKALLPGLAQAEREDIRRLSSYPEDQVGSVMTSDYATLSPDLLRDQAIQRLSQIAPDRETIYQAYVVDSERKIIGVVSLKDLIVAKPNQRIRDIMSEEPVSIDSHAHKSDAVELIADYDLIALPVVDEQMRLVGIVTYDDAMDIAEDEVDSDFQKAAGVSGFVDSLKDASVGFLYQKRVFWLVILVFGNIFSGAGIAYFEDTIATYVTLVFFLPVLIGGGGNAGSQSATLMVRALATGDIELKDWWQLIVRELSIALLLGLTLAAAVSLVGIFRSGYEIALVVSLSMVCIVMVGSLIGMSVPFLLARFKLDPASASAPLITTVTDATGVFIYFFIARALLN